MRYVVSIVSKTRRSYKIASLLDIPEEHKELHKLIQDQFVGRYGWRNYVISRSKYRGELGGFKLVGVFRVTPEAITLLKADTSHPVFPQFPSRHMWWETEPNIPRGITVPRKPLEEAPGPKAALRLAGLIPQPKKLTTRRHKPSLARTVSMWMKIIK